MTAALRPLLDVTLSSLLRWVRCREVISLVLNIDPAPAAADLTARQVADIAGRLFPVAWCHMPDKPSFAAAVRHVWGATRADVVFHVEDDWEFTAPVDLDAAAVLVRDGSADMVRLGAALADGRPVHPVGAPAAGPSLPPGVWRGSLCRALAAGMRIDMDPERQLWLGVNPALTPALRGLRVAEQREPIVCRDLGRVWAQARKLAKWSTTERGSITWG